jgi:3-oxoacyl-[acyl-carrier protein] reductase
VGKTTAKGVDPSTVGCALVTGGSRGIGATVAKLLAADGWAVGVNYRIDEDSAQQVVDAIEEDGGRALPIGADITDPTAVEAMFEQVETVLGPALVLVNSAGARNEHQLSPMIGDEEWQRVIDVNLSATFRVVRRALRGMIRARFGRIVTITSTAGQFAHAGHADYATAKAGQIALTKTVAVEVARRNITVNAVAPGPVESDLTDDLDPRIIERTVPLRRMGTPHEVAACVRFLSSDDAAYVTGSTLVVDGGYTAGINPSQ